MKVTLNWFKQYVGFDWSPERLAEIDDGVSKQKACKVELL